MNLSARKTIGRLLAFSIAAAVTAFGHAQMNRAEPLPGIVTSGQPDQSALQKLADDGFTTVIDLRTPEEDRGIDEKKGRRGTGHCSSMRPGSRHRAAGTE